MTDKYKRIDGNYNYELLIKNRNKIRKNEEKVKNM